MKERESARAAGVGSYGFKSLQGSGACFPTIDGRGFMCVCVCRKQKKAYLELSCAIKSWRDEHMALQAT